MCKNFTLSLHFAKWGNLHALAKNVCEYLGFD